jgi:hypothetical protein
MGLLWAVVRTVLSAFAVIIAVLVVVDGTLLANLLKRKDVP